MRSTPDNDSPANERRKSTRRRAPNPAVPARAYKGVERRLNDRRDSSATSGMRIKSANAVAGAGPQSPNLIAQSMIDALTDILEYEQSQSRAKRAS